MAADLKLTLAQINPTIGDIDGNIALMRDAVGKAHAALLVDHLRGGLDRRHFGAPRDAQPRPLPEDGS